MSKPSLALLTLCATLCVACGDNVGFDPQYQNQARHILTRLEVTPSSISLVPGEWSQLRLKAWDQFGATIVEHFDNWGDSDWWDKTSYSSSAPEIAEVTSNGLVRGVTPGMADITVTLTLDGVKQTATVTATVYSGPQANITVTAKQNRSWSPTTVNVKAGETVAWVVPSGVQIGTIWLNVWEINREKLEFIDGRATHTFSTPGRFYYGTGGGLMWYEEGGVVQVY